MYVCVCVRVCVSVCVCVCVYLWVITFNRAMPKAKSALAAKWEASVKSR